MNLGFILSFMGKYADKMIVGIARLLMIQEI